MKARVCEYEAIRSPGLPTIFTCEPRKKTVFLNYNIHLSIHSYESHIYCYLKCFFFFIVYQLQLQKMLSGTSPTNWNFPVLYGTECRYKLNYYIYMKHSDRPMQEELTICKSVSISTRYYRWGSQETQNHDLKDKSKVIYFYCIHICLGYPHSNSLVPP